MKSLTLLLAVASVALASTPGPGSTISSFTSAGQMCYVVSRTSSTSQTTTGTSTTITTSEITTSSSTTSDSVILSSTSSDEPSSSTSSSTSITTDSTAEAATTTEASTTTTSELTTATETTTTTEATTTTEVTTTIESTTPAPTTTTTSTTTTTTTTSPVPYCTAVVNGNFETGLSPWTAAGSASVQTNGAAVNGYTTPYGNNFAYFQTSTTITTNFRQDLTSFFGSYSVSLAYRIASFTNNGGDNPYCFFRTFYVTGNSQYRLATGFLRSNSVTDWTTYTGQFATPAGSDSGYLIFSTICNPGAQGSCNCDVLFDAVSVVSTNSNCQQRN